MAEVLKGRETVLFEIMTGSDFFFGSTGQCFTCTFYCQTDDGAFPDSEWTDFAQTVLSWWSDAIAGAVHAKDMKFKLLFEDGPFWIDVTKQNDDVMLHFNTDRRNTQTIPDVHMTFYDLAKAVEKAMRSLSSSLYLERDFEASQEVAEQAIQLRKRIS